ncbi:MAG: YjgP/YjgQ family permease [Sphingobacteriales bacterium]|nr:MAG: YjgP/YjgQ family permease [Sphingobacteriales bacterium]
MFKKLDLLLIRAFAGPFVVWFLLTLFVLVMQFFWLYMDELIGKGLEISLILELLLYMSTTMVPLALPLAVLLSSIMTMGSLGENFELVALKSAGISLNRFMRPLLIVIIFLSVGAFLFNNYVIPVANLKALSMLYDLRNSKPTLNIRPGQFNSDIPNFSIRIAAKDKDGKTIRDVVIYDHTNSYGNDKVVVAKKGQMLPSRDGKLLIFRLSDGWRYEEGLNGAARTQVRMHFRQWDKVFDLSSFKVNSTDQNLFAGDQKMMSLGQLSEQIDTLKSVERRQAVSTRGYLASHLYFLGGVLNDSLFKAHLTTAKTTTPAYRKSFIETFPENTRTLVLQSTIGNLRSAQQLVDLTATNAQADAERVRRFQVEWFRKFTMAAACILLFLIGAPMGAIIRKGGLGMPMIVSVVLFLIWYILSFVGEKLAASGSLPPFLGMWGSIILLLPLALFIIRKARNDSPLFQKESYLRIWNALRKAFRKKTSPAAYDV